MKPFVYSRLFLNAIIYGSMYTTVLHSENFTSCQRYLLKKSGLTHAQCNEFDLVIDAVKKASRYQQLRAAEIIIKELKEIIIAKEVALKQAEKEDLDVMHLRKEILEWQYHYLKDFIRIESHYISLTDYLRGVINSWWQKISTIWNQETPSITTLARYIAWYLDIERTSCFQTYKTTMHYFAFQDAYELPPLMCSWQHKPLQFHISQKIKQSVTTPIIQAAGVRVAGEAALVAGQIASETAFPVIAKTVGVKTAETFMQKVGNLFRNGKPRILETPKSEPIGYQGKSGRNTIQQTQEGVTQPLSKEVLTQLQTIDDIATKTMNQTVEVLGECAETAKKTIAQATKELMTKASNAARAEAGEAITFKAGSTAVEKLSQLTEKIGATQGKLRAFSNVIREQKATVLKSSADKAAKQEARKILRQAKREFAEIATRRQQALIKEVRKLAPEIEAELGSGTEVTESLLKNIYGMQTKLGTFTDKFALGSQIVSDMMFQMGLMQGTSKAIAWIEEDKLKYFAQLDAQQKNLAGQLEATLNKIQADADLQQQLLSIKNQGTLEDLASQQKTIDALFANQQTYIMQSLVTRTVADNYLSDPLGWDQYFWYAPMLTPNMPKDRSASSPNPVNLVIPGYKNPAQIFYQGSWAISPIMSIKKITETPMWLFINGNIIPEYKTTQQTQVAPIPSVNLSKLTPLLNTLPKTPVPHTWYNIARTGNWSYDPVNNQFCQYRISSFQNTGQAAGETANLNSIFADYVPPCVVDEQGMQLYQIQAEFTVNSGKPPWIAGIMFNKARWISGITDNMHQYRFCGLYCAEAVNSPIVLCAGETFFVKNANAASTKLQPINPLQQILATPKEQQNWQGTEASKVPNPLYPSKESSGSNQTSLAIGQTYRITLITQPEQIIITLEQKKDVGYTTLLGPIAITNRNPTLFNYHGIGLISAGCSSRFSLLSPQELTYTQAQRDEIIKLLQEIK